MRDVPGPLVIIGGHEDKTGDAAILRRLVHLAGGRDAVIGVVPTASVQAARAVEEYRAVFGRLGVREVRALMLESRADADAREIPGRLAGLTALFFTGGDQLRITSTLGGTAFHQWAREQHRRGLVVAGTSAGASMMSDTMIVGGDADETPTRNTVQMAVGMGFWPGVVVDQHFSQRGRIGRLLSALAQNPAVLGVGIDENTAIEVDFRQRCFAVLGGSTVTVLDGRQIQRTNASESRPGQPLMLSHVLLHVLPKGWRYAWESREPSADQAVEEGSE
jgi:cyanophycinase